MRFLMGVLAALSVQIALAQPATLTLRAKLRDFKDYRATDPSSHPDFENDAYMECGGSNLGYVKDTVALNGTVDTALFAGDNRNPELKLLKHPSKTMACFTSFEKFDDWYNDKPAVNRSFYTDIVLTRNNQGLFVFDDDNFLPLNPGANFKKFRPGDPDPFGPRPEITPNDVWGFTLELHTTFTYTAGGGQVFSFKGDDDVWVFINGRLAIDLGGLHSSLTATVDLDSRAAALGLVDGVSYPLDFFFAERHSTGSHCRITTSLQLEQKTALPAPVASPSGQGFRKSLDVSLTVPNHPDAVVRYTLDGTEPTAASPVYTAALSLSSSRTLKAKAFHDDFLPSATTSETYVLLLEALPQPVATPPGQVFQSSIAVALSVPGQPTAEIRYTLDGKEPDSTSPLYTAPLDVTATTVVKAKAFLKQWLPSPTLSETYTWQAPPVPPVPPPPPNVVSLNLERPVSRADGLSLVLANPVISRPFAVVSVDRGAPLCLDCPIGTPSLVLQSGQLPEWVASSRAPFRYAFHVYDQLGQFVAEQNGSVTQGMLDQVPADTAGYRLIRFRWIPVSSQGQAVGTGAYILKAVVASDSGISQASLFKTFGYIRHE